MRIPIRFLLVGVFFLCVVASAGAQIPVPDVEPSVPSDWQQRVPELQAWVSAYSDWKAWTEKWRNRPEPGWFSYRERRQPPNPPEWLSAECTSLLEADGLLGQACDLWFESQGIRRPTIVQPKALAPKLSEQPAKTIWWEHVHLDVLWPMAQWDSGVYGLIGVHATVPIKGRFQLFVAPGAILMNLPNGPKSREWQPAADFGFAYRLADFRWPGTGQWASLHFNFAKAWILMGPPGVPRSSIELAGFSFTFKRDPK
jgi:hypothetical protein